MTSTATTRDARDPERGRRINDDGTVSVMAAVFAAALLLVLALLVDGSGKMRAISRADTVAAEAARAALSSVDTRGSAIELDLETATAAARDYLSQAGYPGSVEITGPDTVRVTVTLDEPARIGLLGRTYHVTATATAHLEIGTRGAGDGGSS